MLPGSSAIHTQRLLCMRTQQTHTLEARVTKHDLHVQGSLPTRIKLQVSTGNIASGGWMTKVPGIGFDCLCRAQLRLGHQRLGYVHHLERGPGQPQQFGPPP